jgi:hypothetical protein
MKKYLLTVILTVVSMVAVAETDSIFCMYNHDGSVKTFTKSDVDSISYSCIGTDGKTYDDIVTQLIYTNDSIIKTPLSEIDSISFPMQQKNTVTIKDVKAYIWYEDNNLGVANGYPSDIIDSFNNPDTWAYSRKNTSVYMIRYSTINKHPEVFTDAFLQTMVNVLKESNVTWAIDSSSSTWLNKDYTNNIKNCQGEMDLIKKIQKMGGTVSHIGLQSVLSKGLKDKSDYPMPKRIKDCIDYANLMEQNGLWGDIKLGIIDALPTHNDSYDGPYADLKRALQTDGHRLDFILLDCPYEYPQNNINGMSWAKLKQVGTYVKDTLSIEFTLACTSVAGKTSALAYHNNVLDIINQYGKVGGNADHYVIMAWYKHPIYSIPETATDGSTDSNYPMHKTQKMFEEQLANIY